MKILPSRWILSPFGQPSYCVTSCHSAFEFILKILPNGMSTHQRLPCRSNDGPDRKSTRLNSSHSQISYAVFCLKKKKTTPTDSTLLCDARQALYPGQPC